MADTPKMPDGLTTQEIPIAKSIENMVDVSIQTWDMLDDNIKKQEKTDKIQTDVLFKIYEALTNEKLKPEPKQEEPTTDPKEEEERQEKFFDGLKDHLSKVQDKIGSATSNLYDNVMPTLLGPLNLITQPLNELTGIDLVGGMKERMAGIFGKKSSKKPSAEDVAKGGFLGAGFLYLSNTLQKYFGDKDETKEKLKGLFKGGLSGLLGKGLGIGAIVASIGLMIADGIKGAKLSDLWGTSKVSGIIGGVIGGVDKGLKGMFKNMGKWALMGAGIGTLVAPGIGTLIGGLIGGAFGAIANWVGAEKIAKIMDKFGNFFKTIFGNLFGNIATAFQSLLSFDYKGAIEASGGIVPFLIEYTPKALKAMFDIVGSFFQDINESDLVTDLKTRFPIIEKVGNLFHFIFEPFSKAWETVFSELDFKSILESDGSFMNKLGQSIREVTTAWIQGMVSFLTSIGGNVGELWEQAKSSDLLGGARGFFGEAKEGAGDFFKGILGKESTSVNDAIITKTGQVIHTSRDDNIIATKNSPKQIVSMPDMTNNVNVNTNSNEMVDLLKQLVTIMKDKPMGTVINQANQGSDFESLRKLGVA